MNFYVLSTLVQRDRLLKNIKTTLLLQKKQEGNSEGHLLILWIHNIFILLLFFQFYA